MSVSPLHWCAARFNFPAASFNMLCAGLLLYSCSLVGVALPYRQLLHVAPTC